jgi:hypothetical protein
VLDEFQERSLMGLMREFTLTFMQWWGDACAQSQPILHSAIMASSAAAQHVCFVGILFDLVYFHD